MILVADAENAGDKALFLFLRLGAESDLLGQGSALDVRPHALNGFGKLLRALRPKLRKGENLQAAEQRVGNGAGKGSAAQFSVNRGKTALQSQKSSLFVCRPNMLPLIAHGLDQLLVAARLGKLDLIQAAAGIKLQKFVIELHCRIVRIHRQDTRHIAGDRGRVIAFQHTDSLVALLDIESAHILAAADGIPDPLVSQMRLTKGDPFRGKFRLGIEKRHKIAREGKAAPMGSGANDLLRRNIHQAKLDPPCRHPLVQNLLQYLGIGVTALGKGGFVIALPQLPRDGILGDCLLPAHKIPPWERICFSIAEGGEKSMAKLHKISRFSAA